MSTTDYPMEIDADEDAHPIPIPEHLGNEDTMVKLGFIDDLKKLSGINELVNLPQLVVVGDQSSGKSSVLRAITGLLFPVDDGLCTRFPTEVSLQRASKNSLEVSITKPVRAFDALDRNAAQKKWLETQSTRIDTFNNKWQRRDPQSVGFSDIITEAKTAIMGDPVDPARPTSKATLAQNKKNMLSDATLKIVKKGPVEINITIIDIPVNHAAHKMSKALVDHYVFNPRSIILAVAHPANVETQDIFQIIGKIADWKNRVIGVITKCDKVEADGDDWVQKAIRNDESDAGFDRCLSYGWFGLRNLSPAERRAHGDQSVRDEKEEALFSQKPWTDLERPEKLGIKNLKAALTRMHNDHVTRSIPELIPEIQARLNKVKNRIEGLGSPRTTPESQINCLVKLATKYYSYAADAIDGNNDRLPCYCKEVKIRRIFRDELEDFRDRMHSDYQERFNCTRPAFGLDSDDEKTWERSILKNAYLAEIQKCIMDNRGKEMDEVNTAVLRGLWAERTPKWKVQTQITIQNCIASIDQAVEALLVAICEEDSLRNNIKMWLAEDTTAIFKNANDELDRLLHDERSGLIVTLNKWRVHQLQKLRDDRIKHMVDILERMSRRDRAVSENQIKAWFSKHKGIEAIFTTHDKLASYYEIGMLRFVDNVCHQVCERHLLGDKSPLRTFAPDLVTRKFQGDEEGLRRIAGEDKNQLAQREQLEEQRALLVSAMNKAREYGVTIGVQGMGI
ncbi:hypothetical protein NHQ30_004175 [Ciborinia camelliae]|nr:hypothetical protein NHQ30_004175 [Ciborinia camelliae]